MLEMFIILTNNNQKSGFPVQVLSSLSKDLQEKNDFFFKKLKDLNKFLNAWKQIKIKKCVDKAKLINSTRRDSLVSKTNQPAAMQHLV